MKRFLLRLSLFLLPLLLCFLFSFVFYNTEKGDLLRMGYLADWYPNYRKDFEAELNKPILYYSVSELLEIEEDSLEFDIMTIGDSFSEQKAIGYQNYLSELSGLKILHYDGILRKEQPVLELYKLIKGDFFKKFKVKKVILESVERGVGWRSLDTIGVQDISLQELKNRKAEYKIQMEETIKEKWSFSRIAKVPFFNIGYLVNDKAFLSETYKFKTEKTLFSNKAKNILIYEEDISLQRANNSEERILKLTQSLNTIASDLKQQGVSFYFLLAPDKYTIYRDEIVNKEKYPKPQFLHYFNKTKKEFIFINVKETLRSQVANGVKDVYFYDDTHWSPVGSLEVVKKIISIFNE